MPSMSISQVARALGRRGGQARAARLSPEERRRIAALGGHARRRSLELGRRVAENFRYVEAVTALRGGRGAVARMKTCAGPLPGLYPLSARPRA
jgi:hypothetical protein